MANESILIIEDNPLDLKLMKLMLSREGYAVQGANDAESALAAIAQSRPLLILMDIQLGDTGGIELTRRLKADPKSNDIRIVAVTAYPMLVDQPSALSAGCDDYIVKPIDTRSLPAVISRHLGNS